MTTSERRPAPDASAPVDDGAPRDAPAGPGPVRTPAPATGKVPPAEHSRDEARERELPSGHRAPGGPQEAHEERQDEDASAAEHSLNRDGQQGVHDRAASKGRRYAFDQNPSGEANDPSLTSGPTRERKI